MTKIVVHNRIPTLDDGGFYQDQSKGHKNY